MSQPHGRTRLPAFTLGTSLISLLALVTLAALTNLLTLTVLTCVASPNGVSAQGEGTVHTGVVYVKVATTFPSSFRNCKLKAETLKYKTQAACAASCNRTPDCSIYCMKDNVCSLYRARVSHSWPGYASASEANTFASCYSSWAYRDISHLTTVTATSYHSTYLPSHLIDGYGCDLRSSYCTIVYGGSALKVELPEPLAIRVVRVQVSSSTQRPYVFFGNYSLYTENPQIATPTETTIDPYYVITVTPPQDMVGKFLFFRSLENYLYFCEIAIVPF